ncbi:uncharacterized protein LOC131215147 [Anopheles bellator]|uniref:uncharacterized protein LOC131215147 n=1 Tax=Anopheles bellator TaxID=139047 RepID=UPI002648094C|nr:uncharacterized protein LOC131215147 [Anopheles bellator]
MEEKSAIELADNKQQQPSPKSIDLPAGLILVSSSNDGSQDEDHEEGEIPDEDGVEEEKENVRRTAGRVQHDLEDISSEEESNIRERLAELVAMNKELKMIAQINNYNFLSKSDGKDIYYNEHYQHARRRKVGKSSTATSKSSSRRQTVRRERLISSKRHSEKRKDRQSRQDRRNSHRRHKRRKCASPATTPMHRSTFMIETSESECELSYDREFLACSIDNGRKRRLHLNENALKRKLLLPLNGGKREKGRREAVKHNDVVPMVTIDSSASGHETSEPFVVDDDDDDEDEEELQLRLLALRTKPIVKEACLNEMFDVCQVPSPPPPPIISGDRQDESKNCPDNHFAPLERLGSEERELRMIALKSAYTKKHEARLRLKGFGKESERPYSPSDNLVLSPVDEIPPIYDELDNDLFSDGNGSAGEALRPIDDTDDNGNDMEISPADSPARWPIPNETTEDSQLPIDMELASSDPSSELPSESIVFASEPPTDRAKAQSPPMTPDSMGEAEADALRHFLLSKMRQKQKDTAFVETKAEVASEVSMELEQPVPLTDEMDKQSPLATLTNVLPNETSSSAAQNVKVTSPKAGNSNLITLVNRKMVRKRRKKSLSVTNGPGNNSIEIVGGLKNVTATTAAGDVKQPQSETSTIVPKLQVVRTQKLLNNQNKLINLNHTISPSPPLLSATAFAIVRTESPKELTNVETFVSRPVSRMVIQLGHSDSDSDVDFGSLSPTKTSDGVAIAAPPTPNSPAPGPAFEQQLDRFLRSVRSKTISNPLPTTDDAKQGLECSSLTASIDNSVASRQQMMAKKTQSIPADVMATVASSTAVKHLPKSAQMEYTRLIARMAQLERQKNARQRRLSSKNGQEAVVRNPTDTGTNVQQSHSEAMPVEKPAANASLETISQQPNTQSNSFDPSNKHPAIVQGPGKRKAAPLTEVTLESATEIQDPVLRKLHQIKSRLPSISEEGRSRLLLTTERHLVKHSDFFLRQLEQHNTMLVEVQQERQELFQLENRIELMREKLASLERIHDDRRKRSFESITNVQTSHRRIVADRKRSVELARVCVTIGRLVLGDAYQPPSASAEVHLQEQLRILVNETKQLKFIRKPTLEEFKSRILANRRTVLVADSVRVDSAPVVEPKPDDTQKTEHDPMQTPSMAEAQGTSFDLQALESQAHQLEPSTGTADQDEFANPERPGEEELPRSDTEVPAETEPMLIGHVEPTMNKSNTSHEAANEPNATPSECTGNDAQQDLTNRSEVVESMPGKPVHGSEDGFSEPLRFTEYKSPLVSLKQPGALNTTPNGILCPYELDGQCVDRDCKYDHLRQP